MQRLYTYTLALLFLALSVGLHAQNTSEIVSSKGKFLGTTSTLKSLAEKGGSNASSYNKFSKKKKQVKEMQNFLGKKPFPRDFSEHILPKNGDPLAKKNNPTKMMSVEIQELLVLEGIGFNEAGSYPPDVNGDIGLNYYVQGVNGFPSSLSNV